MDLIAQMSFHDTMISFINVVPSQVVYLYMLSKVFEPKSKTCYWLATMVPLVLFTPFRPVIDQVTIFVVATTISVVLPIALLKGGFSQRIIVTFIAFVLLNMADMPAALVLMVVTKSIYFNYEEALNDPGIYCLMLIVHMIILVLFMYVCYRVALRILKPSSRHESNDHERSALISSSFIFLPLTQVMILGILIVVFAGSLTTEVEGVVICFVVLVPMVIADILLLYAEQRFMKSRLLEARARALSDQVDEYLDIAMEEQASLRKAAVLRHDVRNHMQVVASFCERGQRGEARRYLESVKGDMLDRSE